MMGWWGFYRLGGPRIDSSIPYTTLMTETLLKGIPDCLGLSPMKGLTVEFKAQECPAPEYLEKSFSSSLH